MNRYININQLKKLFIAQAIFFICLSSLQANPVLDTVAAGNINIEQNSNQMVVNQANQQGIINWQSFNIGANEAVHFNQPSGGVTLNRINPTQGVSEIYGRLTATGQIILMNPAGIYFGPTAYVNVGGMIATTGQMTNEQFLSGQYQFTNLSEYQGSIINKGTLIAAQHGLIALVGSAVTNDGLIHANLGHVILGSGEKFTVSFTQDNLINFAIDTATTKRGKGQHGELLNDGVLNRGSLIANGGHIIITAHAAANVLDHAINMQGVAQTQSYYQDNGTIVLSSDPNAGKIYLAGKLDASGVDSGERGGTINITGHEIVLASNAHLDVSGDIGGGQIEIGGSQYGLGPLPNAKYLQVDSGAILKADAITHGNGGKIIAWSDGINLFHGNVSAKSGALSGDGGFVETSGSLLDIKGANVNLSGVGKTGQWLLDPSDIEICSGGSCTTTVTMSGNTYLPGGSTSFLDIVDLITALTNANVTVQTTSAGTGNGDIIITTPININPQFPSTSTNDLTLSAYRNIVGQASITNTGTGDVNLIADNTGIGTGTVSFTGGNNVSVNSGSVNVYYNPTVFGTQDIIYTGGTAPTAFMLINSLGVATDSDATTNTRSLATLANSSAYWSDNFALAKNIDASATSTMNAGAGLPTIGNSVTPFTGKFDGQGFQITNLTINNALLSQAGLFGETGATALIRNIGVSGNVSGNGQVGLLVGLNAGTISGAFSNGKVVAAGNKAGGLVGENTGTINNSYSSASVIGATSDAVGGLVGSNSGTLNFNYSIGMVTGLTNAGGLVGTNSGTINNSFWNTDTSGKAAGVGNNTGTLNGLTGGCFSGTCSNGGIKNLSQAATFTDVGFDFGETWGIIADKSYPYLLKSFATTPRAISGNLQTADPITAVPYNNANQTISLAANSSNIGNTQTGANGDFYFLTTTGALTDNYPFLLYVNDDGSTKANTITNAPPSGQSIINLAMQPNTVLIASNDIVTPVATALYSATGQLTFDAVKTYIDNTSYYANTYGSPSYKNFLTNAYMSYALGSITGSNLLYTLSGNNVTVKNGNHFKTGLGTYFGFTGNLSTTNGSIWLDGLSQIGRVASGSSITLQTNTSGDIKFNGFTFWPLTQSTTLNLISANKIYIEKPMLGELYVRSLSVVDPSTYTTPPTPLGLFPFIPISSGTKLGMSATLNITTPYIPQSVVVNGDVLVTSFRLIQGQWYQQTHANDALFNAKNGYTPLPAFGVSGNFRLGTTIIDGSGNIVNTANIEFLRVGGGDGTIGNPYLIGDLWGLQGIGSNVNTLSKSYKMANDIGVWLNTLITTSFWNGGSGFVPIGNALTPFSGTFDGSNYADLTEYVYGPMGSNTNPIVSKYMTVNPISWATAKNVGLFGVNTGTISNLFTVLFTIIGDQNVGLVGNNQGTLQNIAMLNTFNYGNDNVGSLAGINSGIINRVSSSVSSNEGDTNVGGLVGYNSGTINETLSHSYITATMGSAGGIAGFNAGTISSSFWDTDYSGVNVPASNQASISGVYGGCFDGSCTNGGTVSLSSKDPYLAAGWDMSTVWGIDPDDGPSFDVPSNGQSLPYLRMALPNGLTTIQGQTDPLIVNQPIFFINYLFRPNGTLYAFNAASTKTGADGSFIMNSTTRGFVNAPMLPLTQNDQVYVPLDARLMVGTVVGGYAKGTAFGLLQPGGSITNFTLPTSIVSGTPYSTPLTYLQAIALFSGINVNELLALGSGYLAVQSVRPSIVSTGYAFRNIINQIQYLGLRSGETLSDSFMMGVDLNIAEIIKNFDAETLELFSKYQIIPDGCM